MNWIWVFVSFGGRLDRERYKTASHMLTLACWVAAVPCIGAMLEFGSPQCSCRRFGLGSRWQ